MNDVTRQLADLSTGECKWPTAPDDVNKLQQLFCGEPAMDSCGYFQGYRGTELELI